MAVRDSRRKPGMTVGQRMRDFSRSVMRHYAPLPGDGAPAPQAVPPASSVAPPPNWAEPADTAPAEPQFVATAPLPFDAPAAEQAAPLLPPAELPVYAPDPPLPQYVVPATPAPSIQRTEQPAQPAGDIAIGPDGRPLLHNGKPIPVDPDPTPSALLELMQRQRQRDAEVQRLKEERTEILKAELPPAPEDSDAPRSSRIRRRGSADVDYIQTKALADKREPGDTAADPKPNVKTPREPEQREVQSLDDDDESNGDGAGSASFEAPTDAASPVTQSSDISTASDAPAVQRVPDIETPAPFIPFDAPLDAPLAEPEAMPEVSPRAQPFAEPQAPAPLDAPPAPSVAVQRQPDADASELPRPLSEPNAAPYDGRPAVSASTLDSPQIQPSPAVQTSPPSIQRQAAPEIAPSLPFDASAGAIGDLDESQSPVMPAPEMPSVQRGPAREIPLPSLPFDAPAIEQPTVPEIPRPLVVVEAQETAPQPAPTQTASMPPAVQRHTDAEPPAAGLPLDVPVVADAPTVDDEQPRVVAASETSAPPPPQSVPQMQTPAVQRQPGPEIAAPPLPFSEAVDSEPIIPQAERPASPDVLPAQAPVPPDDTASAADPVSQTTAAAIQREPEIAAPARSLPFDTPVDTEATAQELSRPVQSTTPLTAAPDTMPSQPAPTVQRQVETDTMPPLPFEPSPEQPRALEQSQPLPASPDAASHTVTPAIQRQAASDSPRLSLPFDSPTEQQSAPLSQPEQFAAPDAPQSPATAESNTPETAFQRQPELDNEAATLPQTSAPAPTPAIQRHADAEMAAPRPIPFDAPEIEQAVPEVSQDTQAQAPSVQRFTEPENIASPVAFDTPLAKDPADAVGIPEPSSTPVAQSPAIQRLADTEPAAQSLPFDAAPVPDLTVPDAQPAVSEAAPASTPDTRPQPETAASAPQTSVPTVQRQADAESVAPSLPFDVPAAAPSELPVSESGLTEAGLQRQAETPAAAAPLPFDTPALPADMFQAGQPPVQLSELSQAVAASSSPVAPVQREPSADASVTQPDVPAPVVQRELERVSTPQTPFDAATQARPTETADTPQLEVPVVAPMPTQAAAPSSPEPVLQRDADEASGTPLPFDDSQPEQTESSRAVQAAMPDVLHVDQPAPLEVLPHVTTPPSIAPTVQRQTAPETAPVPLSFDQPPAEQPTVSQAQSAPEPELSVPEPASTTQTPAAIPTAQRQEDPETAAPRLPFDTPADAPEIDSALEPAAFQSLPQMPMPPVAQRQADVVSTAPAPEVTANVPAALPFDDLDVIPVQRMPVQQAAQAQQSAVLPFDPVSPEGSPAIQRTAAPEPADPFSTPSTMPAGVPADSRMDVFQALVAAGMVSRPPGGSTIPAASSPHLQRSPSREAYLASMAQRQESAGAVSGPIQRALTVETESNSPAPESGDDGAPEIDVDQLASDVMRVLRGKLRSEHERLSKR